MKFFYLISLVSLTLAGNLSAFIVKNETQNDVEVTIKYGQHCFVKKGKQDVVKLLKGKQKDVSTMGCTIKDVSAKVYAQPEPGSKFANSNEVIAEPNLKDAPERIINNSAGFIVKPFGSSYQIEIANR